MLNKRLATIVDATTEEESELAIQYAQLSSLPSLTEEQGKQLQKILDLACTDGTLSFWISEFDHILGHELGLLNPDYRRDYDNKKALLKEYLMDFIEEDIADKQPKEIRVFLEKYVSEKTGTGIPNQLNTLHRPQLGGYRYPSNHPIGG